jgi:16S rRNA A1518/A1519 N6-dimethyltransferase RsmA/KsgA/DIM1 with predicted DNA glycosylase/AP lyase activity
MLRASFKRHGGGALIEEAGIDPASRPQDLPIEAFCALARLYRERREQP